jgi:tetraacyldisaccharide 4'-kinase
MTVPERVSVPVVCVGNFTAGGAGKTPTAIAVAERLTLLGETPHFVSRGYGGKETGPILVDPSQHMSQDVGDEPLLLSQHSPAWVSADRVAGALAAESAGASIILLDDGFQNPTLHKDLSLVVVDTGSGVGNGTVLPAGPLREPLEAAFKRTHALISLGSVPLAGTLLDLARMSAVPVLTAQLQPASHEASKLVNQKLIAFAGIGRPEKFFSTLQEFGAEIVRQRPFPDHHPFSEADARELLDLAAETDATLVTTEKDMVRLQPLTGTAGTQLRETTMVLPVSAKFENFSGLDELLTQFLKAARASHTYAPPGSGRDTQVH